MPYQSGSSAQRIRYGLTGLAFAFLVVLLGSAILRSSRDDNVNAVQNAATNEPTEPLAELGVAPGSSEIDQQQQHQEVTLRRWRFAAAVIAVIVAAAVAVAIGRRELASPAPRAPSDRPTLLLLTSLPLVLPDQFTLKGGGSPALKALETRYRVAPISVTDEADLAQGRFLLMAHPLAQPAEDLVALDEWVRRGGRVLLLADPLLEWPSSRPLGDQLRPPPMFMDTGLLAHWGLRLDSPDKRGPRQGTLVGRHVLTDSPGRLVGRCAIGAEGLVARCRIGKGRATIIADADFLDAERLGRPANLDALLAELAALEQG